MSILETFLLALGIFVTGIIIGTVVGVLISKTVLRWTTSVNTQERMIYMSLLNDIKTYVGEAKKWLTDTSDPKTGK